jgi:sigma-E factor negative regulatory protein RseC
MSLPDQSAASNSSSTASNASAAYDDARLLEQGIVLAREGNTWVVAITKGAGCGGCEAQAGCISSAVSRLQSQTLLPIPVAPGDAYQVGDSVTVAISGKALRSASLIAYLAPLIGLLVGIAAAGRLSDAAQLALGVLGLLCGFGVAKGLLRYLSPQGLAPEIVGFAAGPGASHDGL